MPINSNPLSLHLGYFALPPLLFFQPPPAAFFFPMQSFSLFLGRAQGQKLHSYRAPFHGAAPLFPCDSHGRAPSQHGRRPLLFLAPSSAQRPCSPAPSPSHSSSSPHLPSLRSSSAKRRCSCSPGTSPGFLATTAARMPSARHNVEGDVLLQHAVTLAGCSLFLAQPRSRRRRNPW